MRAIVRGKGCLFILDSIGLLFIVAHSCDRITVSFTED